MGTIIVTGILYVAGNHTKEFHHSLNAIDSETDPKISRKI